MPLTKNKEIRHNMMVNFQETLEKINKGIQEIAYGDKPVELYDPIRHVMSLGGKRIRPALTLLAYNLYKEDMDSILPVALGWEIFHNFTLLHDDLMDRANMRRGKPTVHKQWGDNTAILSGDAMLILAYQYIAQAPSPYLNDILELFSRTAAEICGGQQYDMDFESRPDVSEAEYMEMIRLKTAVMLGACLKTGAILGGGSNKEADTLYDFGIHLGLAFQLKDDLLDVFGDPAVFGKKIGGDILCNKKTFLLISALNKATGKTKADLLAWLATSDPQKNEEKIREVTRIFRELGLEKISDDKIQYLSQKAVVALNTLNFPAERAIHIHQLATELTNRTL